MTWSHLERAPRPTLALAAGLLALASACGEDAAPPPEPSRPVKLLTIGGPGGGGRLEYPGTIEAEQHAELGFEVPGKIIELHASEGQQVAEGEVLAKLDARDYEAKLEAERAQLKQADAELERTRYLYEKGIDPRVDVERRQRNRDVIAANLAKAQKAVEDATLRAPFAGRVARRLVENFQNVQAKQTVLILQDPTSLEIEVAVPERDIVRGRGDGRIDPDELRARLDPQVVVSSLPDLSFPATLEELSTAADPVTRTYQATFSFPRPEGVNVLPGMTAKITILPPRTTGGEAVLTIPAAATLADEEGGAYVWLFDAGSSTVTRRPVELGVLTAGNVEVKGGLARGDRIAVSGVHQLREGMDVRPLEN